MSSFETLISKRRITNQLKKIGKQLHADYKGDEVTLVMVMKGALCLTADLLRVLKFPTVLEYLSASSYGTRGTERGELIVQGLSAICAANKHILLIDDVYHTGHTLFHIVSEFKKQSAKSVKSLVLLYKDIPRDIAYKPDYYLFKIGNPFVIGYGMDYKEHYRGLPEICIFEKDHR